MWGAQPFPGPPSRRASDIATVLAALGMLVMSSGAALMISASSASADPISQPNSNHEDYWATLPGEVCTKTDSGADSGNVVLPPAPEGLDYSKLIIKKGSGNIGVENQVFTNPVAGQPGYEWQGFDSGKNGGWSHFIVCTVPEPVVEPEVIAVDIVFVDPTCANQNQASYTVTGDTDDVNVSSSTPAAPGATVKVTATAKAGFEFAGGADEYSETYEFDEAETPCDEVEPPTIVTPPAPTFVDPTCDDPTADVTYEDVHGVTYSVVGEIAPGALVEVQANAAEGVEFPEGATTSWEHTFDEVPADCDETETPGSETETPGEPVTPSVVHAGLSGQATDLRGQQGLALLAAGSVLVLAGGGVGLRARRR